MSNSVSICPICASSVNPTQAFCSTCGAKLHNLTSSADIDTYVRGRVVQELKTRLDSEDRISSALAVAAEVQLWEWIKRFGSLLAIFIVVVVAVVGYFGVKTFHDTVGGVAKLVTDAAREVQADRDTISKTASQAAALKAQVKALSGDVEAQEARVRASGDEITQRIGVLNRAEVAAESGLNAELARAKKLGDQLTITDHAVQTAVAKVSQQQDDALIIGAFPGLGQPTYITYNGGALKGPSAKAPSQKWLGLSIPPTENTKLTPKIVEGLVDALKVANVVILTGYFGTGGAELSTFVPQLLPQPDGPALIYFRSENAASATVVAAICSRALGFTVPSYFTDPNLWPTSIPIPQMRRVALESGLDFQLVLKGVPTGLVRAR